MYIILHICIHKYYMCIFYKLSLEEKSFKFVGLTKFTNILNWKFAQGHKKTKCQNVNSEPECFSVSI